MVQKFLTQAYGLFEEVEHLELTAAENLLGRARHLISGQVDRTMADAAHRLSAYDGLPVPFDVLGTLGVTHSETVHNNLLAWVLDPDGSHGLGDSVLRRFLSRLQDRPLVQVAASAEGVQAVVQREAPVGTGYLDLLVALRGVVVSIECKVWSDEHVVKDPNGSAMQTAYYRTVLETPAGRVAALSPSAQALVGAAPRVVGVFIRPGGRPVAADAPARTRTLSWLDVERDIGEALARVSVDPSTRALLEGFRTTLLESTGSIEPLMPTVQHLRLLADATALRHADPMGTYLCLRTFLREDESDG